MPDILVRDVPSEVADALIERAQAAGDGLPRVVTLPFRTACSAPIVKVSYTLQFFGPQDEVYGSIMRSPDGKVSFQLRPVPNFSPEQRLAIRQAGEAVRRNDPGDREKAFKILGGVYEEVYEIPYWKPARHRPACYTLMIKAWNNSTTRSYLMNTNGPQPLSLSLLGVIVPGLVPQEEMQRERQVITLSLWPGEPSQEYDGK